ncbi:hypothetical protein AXG93_93s1450 [Marchantia polymorpha subsp. ruderalis]|uniref:Uncharacterized protein n=1 Tax=Marchantia polymorpha subsp. ruderalis TaxID=1480154 RepID=A0A176WUL9_MARPO|nr:hypothetical protein AXG93_93s1450 [Marchantia polymorpha subsp. ruderalis]
MHEPATRRAQQQQLLHHITVIFLTPQVDAFCRKGDLVRHRVWGLSVDIIMVSWSPGQRIDMSSPIPSHQLYPSAFLPLIYPLESQKNMFGTMQVLHRLDQGPPSLALTVLTIHGRVQYDMRSLDALWSAAAAAAAGVIRELLLLSPV